MKASRFNIVYERGENIFLFNAIRGSFLRVTGLPPEFVHCLGEADAMAPIREEPLALSWPDSRVQPQIATALIEGGYILQDDIDEMQLLRVANRISRYSSEALSLTILTTLSCNFNCVYCYEDKRQEMLSPIVEKKITQFVEHQFPSLRSFGVTWFGGEPLIGISVIENLSSIFQVLCKKNNASYQADIISNGYLLTRLTAEKLKKCGVKSVQITLDGVGDIHNQRRPLKNGKGTFDKIFENISQVHDLLAIVIRMNLDTRNAGNAKALISFLADHNMQDKVQLSFAPVHSEGKGCRDRSTGCQNDLFNIEKFTTLQTELCKFAYKSGFPFYNHPRSKSNACSADLVNSFVIEPDGTLQKCWQTVSDPAESIGDVFKGTLLRPNLLKWLDYDPFTISKCVQCRVLPLCMGWCPNKIIADPSPESCYYVRHTIIQDLSLYYENFVAAKGIQGSGGSLW